MQFINKILFLYFILAELPGVARGVFKIYSWLFKLWILKHPALPMTNLSCSDCFPLQQGRGWEGRAQFPCFDVSVRKLIHGDVERFRAYY